MIPQATQAPHTPPSGAPDADNNKAISDSKADPKANPKDIRQLQQLLDRLALNRQQLPPLNEQPTFPLRVPLEYLQRIRPGDPNDPLLRQILPLAEENQSTPGYHRDPVGDQAAQAAPALLHKYRGRVLLNATPVCAIHCRYCFRQHFPYDQLGHGPQAWQQALDYIRQDPSIDEIILSGGDPLSLSDRRLGQLIKQLNAINSLKRLRIHSRQPVVTPSRITPGLIDTLQQSRLPITLVLHINHAQEIDPALRDAIARLRPHCQHLLNQAVLLKDINDSPQAQIQLSEALSEAGILPYYLHLLDKAHGTAHFDIPQAQALALHRALREQLPGYLVPKLVRETAGEPGKSWQR